MTEDSYHSRVTLETCRACGGHGWRRSYAPALMVLAGVFLGALWVWIMLAAWGNGFWHYFERHAKVRTNTGTIMITILGPAVFGVILFWGASLSFRRENWRKSCLACAGRSHQARETLVLQADSTTDSRGTL